MSLFDYQSVGDWYDSMKAEGISVPLVACNALTQVMGKLNLSFQDAYQLLIEKSKLILENKTYIVDLSVEELWAAKP